MDDRHERLSATIDSVLLLATQWPDQMSHPHVVVTLEELRMIRQAIAELRSRELPANFTSIRAAQRQAWSDVLREDHLMVIQSQVRLHLTDQFGDPLKLDVPHRRASATELLQYSAHYEALLRPHLQELVTKKVSPDILTAMNEAAVELKRWLTEAPDQHQEQKGLRADIRALIARGRQAIKLLGRQLAGELRPNAEFRSQFESAIKSSVKPGPPKAKGDGSDKQRRVRPASHTIRAIPLSQFLK